MVGVIVLVLWGNPRAGLFAATNLSMLVTMNEANELMDFAVTISNN
jgi:hypothetical protein